jgi:hypothetical protein
LDQAFWRFLLRIPAWISSSVTAFWNNASQPWNATPIPHPTGIHAGQNAPRMLATIGHTAEAQAVMIFDTKSCDEKWCAAGALPVWEFYYPRWLRKAR